MLRTAASVRQLLADSRLGVDVDDYLDAETAVVDWARLRRERGGTSGEVLLVDLAQSLDHGLLSAAVVHLDHRNWQALLMALAAARAS
jgi:hypothetical protein